VDFKHSCELSSKIEFSQIPDTFLVEQLVKKLTKKTLTPTKAPDQTNIFFSVNENVSKGDYHYAIFLPSLCSFVSFMFTVKEIEFFLFF
jgi:hypothetical protein